MTDATATASPASPARIPSELEAFANVLVATREFFEKLRPLDARSAALRFAGLMGFLPAAALLLSFPVLFFFARTGYAHPLVLTLGFLGTVALRVIVGPLVAIVVGAYGVGLLVHGIGKLSGGAGTYDRSVVIAAYALAPLVLERVLARLLFFVPLIREILRITPFVACGFWAFIVATGVVALHGGRRSIALAAAVVAAPLVLLLSRLIGA